MKKIYIAVSAFGIIATDNKGNIVSKCGFKGSPEDVAEKLIAHQSGWLIRELREVIEDILKKGCPRVNVEAVTPLNLEEEIRNKVEFSFPNKAGKCFRSKIEEIAIQHFGFKNTIEAEKFLFEVSLALTSTLIRDKLSRRDLSIIHAVHVLDDLEKTLNLLFTRVKEWYSMHFPEIFEILDSQESIAKLILEFNRRKAFAEKELVEKFGFSATLARRIVEASVASIGSELDEKDLAIVLNLVNEWLKLKAFYDLLKDYIDETSREIAPNMCALVGPTLTARLISLSGGLDNLSKLPASTIQLLGAEKALFRYIRGKGTPPKHGIIFQYPLIRKAPKNLRGKIARKLANKLAIAARVDAFSRSILGEEFVKVFQEETEKILLGETSKGGNLCLK